MGWVEHEDVSLRFIFQSQITKLLAEQCKSAYPGVSYETVFHLSHFDFSDIRCAGKSKEYLIIISHETNQFYNFFCLNRISKLHLTNSRTRATWRFMAPLRLWHRTRDWKMIEWFYRSKFYALWAEHIRHYFQMKIQMQMHRSEVTDNAVSEKF